MICTCISKNAANKIAQDLRNAIFNSGQTTLGEKDREMERDKREREKIIFFADIKFSCYF